MGLEEQRFKVIALLIEIEESAKALYEVFAENFPEHREFFEEMAKEEKDHVGLIRTLGASVASGEARYNPEKFNPEEIQDTIQWMKEQIRNAQKNEMTFKDALAVSLGLEDKMVEKSYFEIFEPVSEGVKEFMEGVLHAQDKHCDRVRKLYDKES